MADLMAEGMEPGEARRAARQMAGIGVGPEAGLVMPAREAPLIRLVVAASGQWRMVGGGITPLVPVGFDMVALDVIARWLGITPDARLLDGLAIIEREAMRLMRAK